jgi:hypothetical protein
MPIHPPCRHLFVPVVCPVRTDVAEHPKQPYGAETFLGSRQSLGCSRIYQHPIRNALHTFKLKISMALSVI